MWIVAAVIAAACTVGLGTGCRGDKSSEAASGSSKPRDTDRRSESEPASTRAPDPPPAAPAAQAAAATSAPPADFPVPLPDGTTGAFSRRVLGHGGRALSGTVTWDGSADQAADYFERVLRKKGLEPTVTKVAGTRGETVTIKARTEGGPEARVLIMASGGRVTATISWRAPAPR